MGNSSQKLDIKCGKCGKGRLLGRGTVEDPYKAVYVTFCIEGPYICCECGNILLKVPFKNKYIDADGTCVCTSEEGKYGILL